MPSAKITTLDTVSQIVPYLHRFSYRAVHHFRRDFGELSLPVLLAIKTPTLILQGTRAPFGTQEEVASYPLVASVHLHLLKDGEPSFKPSKASGRTELAN